MASVAGAAPAGVAAPAGRGRRAVAARRPAKRRRTASGVAWIVVATVLLAGVVALNVAVLQRNLALDRLARERAQLQADTTLLLSRLSSAAAAAKIEQLARKRGLVAVDPAAFTYVYLSRPAK